MSLKYFKGTLVLESSLDPKLEDLVSHPNHYSCPASNQVSVCLPFFSDWVTVPYRFSPILLTLQYGLALRVLDYIK